MIILSRGLIRTLSELRASSSSSMIPRSRRRTPKNPLGLRKLRSLLRMRSRKSL